VATKLKKVLIVSLVTMLHQRFFTFLLHYMKLATAFFICRIQQLSHPQLCFNSLTSWLYSNTRLQIPRSSLLLIRE